jgi:hypothetical protein
VPGWPRWHKAGRYLGVQRDLEAFWRLDASACAVLALAWRLRFPRHVEPLALRWQRYSAVHSALACWRTVAFRLITLRWRINQ